MFFYAFAVGGLGVFGGKRAFSVEYLYVGVPYMLHFRRGPTCWLRKFRRFDHAKVYRCAKENLRREGSCTRQYNV